MLVRLPKIDYSNVRPHWAPCAEFAHDRNATSTIPSQVEPYLIQVMRRAKAELPASETALHREIDLFIGQEGAHFRQHNLFNRRIREHYPKLADFEAELKADLEGFLTKRSLKFNIAYAEGFETLGPPSAMIWFEKSEQWIAGADEAPVALWKWHMAEEYEHRDFRHRLLHALYARSPWGRFVNGWLYRLYGVWTAATHLGRYSKRARAYLLETDRASMDAAGVDASKRRMKAVDAFTRRHMLPALFRALSPFHDPERWPKPRGLDAYLARFERGGDLGPTAAATDAPLPQPAA